MLKITNHQVNANQNHSITLHVLRWLLSKRLKDKKCWPGCGETKILVQYWQECKMVQLILKAAWRYLRKLELEIPNYPENPFLSIHSKEMKTGSQRHLQLPCSLHHYSQQTGYRNKSNVYY